jgi:hypothetical protein
MSNGSMHVAFDDNTRSLTPSNEVRKFSVSIGVSPMFDCLFFLQNLGFVPMCVYV